ncbi:IS481 family transposase [Nitrospira sp.]|nr:IS481 family transposase [Nitrospira sp.]
MQLRQLPRSFRRVSQALGPELSQAARTRLQAVTVWQPTGDWRLVVQVFGLSRASLYRWRRRYQAADLRSLEARSRRPRQIRQPQTPPAVVARLCQLRQQYPRWGREKLRIVLRHEGLHLSAKTIDRVLARLRATGQLVEPSRPAISTSCRRRGARPYAIRKPRAYAVTAPGNLVQVDTLDVRPLPGLILKPFTARDVISRWDVFETYRRATSVTAPQFLATLQRRMPVPIRAIQVDGGSEFAAAFEQACQQEGIRLFVLPPRSPKLNGAVERANRTHTEEFFESYAGELDLPTLRAAQRDWEDPYDHIRPHQALGYLTPAAYLAHHPTHRPPSHMS